MWLDNKNILSLKKNKETKTIEILGYIRFNMSIILQ